MAALIQDCRYAMRTLAKAPGLTAIVLLTIGIGTGANATVFSFVNALLLRAAPGVSHPSTLVALYTSDYSSTPYGESSYPDYLSLKADATAFEAMAAYQEHPVSVVRLDQKAERVRVLRVSAEYFDLLGLRPAAGRLLSAVDSDPGGAPTAVISHAFWTRAFGAQRAAIGSTVDVAGQDYAIVGVAPPRFQGLDLGAAFDVWIPLIPPPATPEERQNRGYEIVARLRPGSSLTDAQVQVRTIADRLAHAYPETNMGTLQAPGEPRPMHALRHTRIQPQFRAEVATLGGVIMAAVVVVLLIACANVAGLLLSRAAFRAREVAIRLALGAGRARLLRQFLTESLILGLGGGAVGLLFAMWTADALPSFFPPEQARMLDSSVDAQVVAFTAVAALLSSLLFGTIPALHGTRSAALSALRGGSAGRASEGRPGTHLRRALVVAQIALALVLLVSASLLARSLFNSLRADPGFGARDAVVASLELPPADFTPARGRAYYDAAAERLLALPGVEAVGLARTLPLSRGQRRGFRMEGYVPRPGEDTELHLNIVSPGYFDTLKIPILSGRRFDRGDSAGVAIVNDALAMRFFDGDAVGRRLTDSAGRVVHIIGIARSGRYRTVQEPEPPQVYYPLSQSYSPRMTIVGRTAGDAAGQIEVVRRALQEVNSGAAVFRTRTLRAHVEEALTGDKLTASLLGVCAAMALVLAVVGVYGVVAYAVARRTREIGVRIALGARRRDVVRLVAGEGIGLTAGGIAIGLAAAAALTRLLGTMLYGVSPTDAFTYTTAPALLAIVGAAAAAAPLRRALAVDPIAVLRQD